MNAKKPRTPRQKRQEKELATEDTENTEKKRVYSLPSVPSVSSVPSVANPHFIAWRSSLGVLGSLAFNLFSMGEWPLAREVRWRDDR